MINKNKDESYNEFNDAMSKEFKNNKKLVWNMVNRVKGGRKKAGDFCVTGLSDENGEVKKDLTDIKQIAEKYFSEIGE